MIRFVDSSENGNQPTYKYLMRWVLMIARPPSRAIRKAKTYGTILVDLDKHHPVDLLEGRTAEGLRNWLKAYRSSEPSWRKINYSDSFSRIGTGRSRGITKSSAGY